ncbi:MAG TPA: hypothetical protein VGC02_00925 [Methanobacterium sp.]
MENQDDNDILSPEERKKKLNKKEKRKAKKDIEGKKSSVLTFKGKESENE